MIYQNNSNIIYNYYILLLNNDSTTLLVVIEQTTLFLFVRLSIYTCATFCSMIFCRQNKIIETIQHNTIIQTLLLKSLGCNCLNTYITNSFHFYYYHSLYKPTTPSTTLPLSLPPYHSLYHSLYHFLYNL